MVNNIHSKFYISLVIALGIFTYLLNCFNKIYQCSFVFILLLVTANVITRLYGMKKFILAMLMCAVISFAVLWNVDYYIHGRVINGLVLASLISVLISTYASTILFSRLKLSYSFNSSNLFSLLIGSLLDGFVMAVFFVNIFSTNKVFFIFYKEVMTKWVYTGVIYLCIFTWKYLTTRHDINDKVMN